MNKTIIIGNLTRDPDVRTTKTGKTVCTFNVAVNGRRNSDGTSEVEYFSVNAWSNLAERCAKYLSKGKKVCVDGSVSVRMYEGKDGKSHASLELLASNVQFLSPSEKVANENNDHVEQPVQVYEEDLPF